MDNLDLSTMPDPVALADRHRATILHDTDILGMILKASPSTPDKPHGTVVFDIGHPERRDIVTLYHDDDTTDATMRQAVVSSIAMVVFSRYAHVGLQGQGWLLHSAAVEAVAHETAPHWIWIRDYGLSLLVPERRYLDLHTLGRSDEQIATELNIPLVEVTLRRRLIEISQESTS